MLKSFAFGVSAMVVVASSALAAPALAGVTITGSAPPAGNVILNLDGTPAPQDFMQYSVQFVATSTATDLTFALRDDPARLTLDDVVLSTSGGSNLIANGDFNETPFTNFGAPEWTYDPNPEIGVNGFVVAGKGRNGTPGFFDGADNGYDGISQTIKTTIGATYDLTFFLRDESGLPTFHAEPATPGDFALNLVVLADPVGGVPEPASWALLILGFGGVGAMVRQKRQVGAATKAA